MKYLLDCDPGIDDAMAIMMLVKSGADIAGITTTHGNSNARNTAKNAMKVLEHVLHRKDIPVAVGESRPLSGVRVDAGHVHGKDGLAETALPRPKTPFVKQHAVDFMKEKISENKDDIKLVSTGPLTNIARLLKKYPTVGRDVAELVMMAGAINVPGNITQVAEFNVYADPYAASHVFENSTIRKTLVPADVANKVILTPSYLEEKTKTLRNESNKEVADFLVRIASFYQKFFIEKLGRIGDQIFNGCAMYDPLAVGYAINPSFIKRKEPMSVHVETRGTYTKGETVAELRGGFRNQTLPNMDVCLDTNASEFLDYFMLTVLS